MEKFSGVGTNSKPRYSAPFSRLGAGGWPCILQTLTYGRSCQLWAVPVCTETKPNETCRRACRAKPTLCVWAVPMQSPVIPMISDTCQVVWSSGCEPCRAVIWQTCLLSNLNRWSSVCNWCFVGCNISFIIIFDSRVLTCPPSPLPSISLSHYYLRTGRRTLLLLSENPPDYKNDYQ